MQFGRPLMSDEGITAGVLLTPSQAAQAGKDIRAIIAYHQRSNLLPQAGEMWNIDGVSPFGLVTDQDGVRILVKYLHLLQRQFVLLPPLFPRFPHLLMGDNGLPLVDMRSWPQSRFNFLQTIRDYVEFIARTNRSAFDRHNNQYRYEHLYGRVVQYNRLAKRISASDRINATGVNPVSLMRRELGGRQKFFPGSRPNSVPGRPLNMAALRRPLRIIHKM